MSIRIADSCLDFYKPIYKEGEDILITVPQFYTATGFVPKFYEQTDKNRYYFEAKTYTITVDISGVLPQLDECWNVMRRIPHIRGVKKFHTGNKIQFEEEQIKNCIFMHADGSIANRSELQKKQCTILLELFVKGIRCTNGFTSLDILLNRCMFINTDGEARVNLAFPVEKLQPVIQPIPSHMLSMFVMLPVDQRICTICTEEMARNVHQTKCCHFFHVDCIRKVVKKECPICRTGF